MTFTNKFSLKNILQIMTVMILIALAFILDTPDNIWSGYISILTVEGLWLTDFLAIGGLGATFINVAITLLINFLMIHFLKIKFNGPVIAGLFTIAGFAFLGKTVINILPIYLGIYLYSLYSKVEFKNYIIVTLFSTGISPLVSFIWFGTPWILWVSIPLGIFAGIVVGFFLQLISANAMKFHKGYNLYNIGFTLGVIAMLFNGLFKALKIPLNSDVLVRNDDSQILFVLLLIMSVSLIVGSSFTKNNLFANVKKIISRTGRAVTDFVRESSVAAVCFNMGMLGIIALVITLIFGIPINGLIVGGILTVVGFGAFGKHITNVLPVMAGALIASFVFGMDLTLGTAAAGGILFVSALAPIAGHYGILAGLIAGFMHMFVLPMTIDFQGGFDLYNNGFAAGFVAAVLVPIFEIVLSKGNSKNVETRN